MWTVWVCFVVFLSEPHRLLLRWPLSTVDHGGWVQEPWAAALIDLSLVALLVAALGRCLGCSTR